MYTCCFFPFCHLSPTSLFLGSSQPSPWPLILQPWFLSLLFNHLSSHLYLLSLLFIFSAGWSVFFHFSPPPPIPCTPSQSLLLQLDSPLRQQGHQGAWTVYKGWGSLSLSFTSLHSCILPYLSGLKVCSHQTSDLPKRCHSQSALLYSQTLPLLILRRVWGD